MRSVVTRNKVIAEFVSKVLKAFSQNRTGPSIDDILYTERLKCAFCHGSGLKARYVNCPVCGGSGHNEVRRPALTCAYCRGNGRDVGDLTCPVCRGRGVVSVTEPLKRCPRCGGIGRNRTGRLYCLNCEGKGVVSARDSK